MTEHAFAATHGVTLDRHAPVRPKLDVGFDLRSAIIFVGLLVFGLFFVAYNLYLDVTSAGTPTTMCA